METVYQSLSSVYSAQILMATHSPVVVSHADPEDVICFKKDDTGATDMVLGSEHPQLAGWQGDGPRIFGELAERIGLSTCTDPAFAKFRTTLQHWFPPP